MAKRIATIYDLARYCRESDYDCRRCLGYEYENCLNRLIIDPDKANEKLLKWCDEHPVKTYKDDFLKKFPNANIYKGFPTVCRDAIYGISKECSGLRCEDCWNEVYRNEQIF